jgi:hypothetical protein
MAKSKRTLRAKNKIAGAQAGELIKVEPDRFVDAPQSEQRVRAVAVARSTLFTAELEAVIEIIATERVYRAMLDGLKRRLLTATPPLLIEAPEAFE